MRVSSFGRKAAIAMAVLSLAGVAQAQTSSSPSSSTPSSAGKKPAESPKAEPETSRWGETRKKAVDIGSQPARDVGMSKREIPPILEKALGDPYSLKGLKTCVQLSGEVRKLNEVLGADYGIGGVYAENRAGKLAEAGGKTLINSIIPFRSLVREVTGAAPADRHMNAVVDAGLARRGFLRGVHYKQGCKTKF